MPDTPSSLPAGRVFRRLLQLLRPQWGNISLGVLLLLLSMPAELFPAFIWLYVADGLAMKDFSNRPVRIMHALCSFGGQIHAWPWLLVSDRDDGARLFGRYAKRTWTEELFRDEKIPKPWFKTVQEFDASKGAAQGTQDLYFMANCRRAGHRIASDNRVAVGHYDHNTGQTW